MKIFELKQKRAHALGKAEAVMLAAESAKRTMTDSEAADYELFMGSVQSLNAKIDTAEKDNTLRAHMSPSGLGFMPGGRPGARRLGPSLTTDYETAFYDHLASNGQKVSAALYEGSGSAGGFAVPVMVDGQVVPLAPTDMGVREIANVIPTSMDIKIPRAITFSTSAGKAEGTGSGSNLFQESEPALDQFTLSAYMAGLQHVVSWELASDVPSFQNFAIGDMLLAQTVYEENLYVNGTGSGQAQGLLGNVGAGITGVASGSDNYISELLDATYDVQGTLKGAYQYNASWLMLRATSVALRKAQKQANLFEPVFTSVNGKDYLHGKPVTYSTAMPGIAAGATPILFGDFKQGYVIGDRGGSGINVKILDQPRATEGLIVLLAYRRTDGRVRRSEAIQGITLHS